jgi:hypothetical protein
LESGSRTGRSSSPFVDAKPHFFDGERGGGAEREDQKHRQHGDDRGIFEIDPNASKLDHLDLILSEKGPAAQADLPGPICAAVLG